MNDVLLDVVDLKEYYPVRTPEQGKTFVKALDGVTFQVAKGEVFGIVGESGCGKSTMGLSICRLIEPTSGQVIFDGKNITKLSKKQLKEMRKSIQMVFQDPYASLNPRMSIHDIIAEPLKIHGLCRSREEMDNRVTELLRLVGLDTYHGNRYPHEFSGGQRQRVGIARALAVEPELIVADEPVSALDVSIQSQILNLMSDLKNKLGLTYIFISHDLSVVEHISDRVGVMYLGNFVEKADKEELYKNPLHPYTKALLSAIPVPEPHHKSNRTILEGNIPSPVNVPPGCKFHPRCKDCMEICKKEPPKETVTGDGHIVYCHLYDKERATSQV